jgi:hypothetical protein
LTGIGEISAEIWPTGLTGPLRYFSVKRSVASAITIVLLVTLSLDATVDAGDAIIRVPSNGKGEGEPVANQPSSSRAPRPDPAGPLPPGSGELTGEGWERPPPL